MIGTMTRKPRRILPIELRHRFFEGLLQEFPEINEGGGYALDIGCGSGYTRSQLESIGYRWVGVDMTLAGSSIRADAHRLPFPSGSFDLIVSLAALEHMRRPWCVAWEIGRVARPGALFCGSVAFLEPMHDGSCFHMSHLGIRSFLDEGGFEVMRMWPGWHEFEAIAWFNLVENAGRRRGLYEPARSLARFAASVMHRLRAWRLGAGSWDAAQQMADRLRFSGSICFVARRC